MGAHFRKRAVGQFYAALVTCVQHACQDYGRKLMRHEKHSAGSIDEKFDSESDAGRYDTSQVMAGTQSNTYSGALALIGSQQVTSIDLVVDSGWFFNPKRETVLVRNVQINGQTFFAPQQQPSSRNPAKACKAELAAIGTTAFEHKYGSNHNLKNALGKCVSAKAHQHR